MINFLFFLKKWANSAHFFIYFWSFQTNITIFTTKICEKCPSSIWCQDSKPQPLECESLPIMTRPGLPPLINFLIVLLLSIVGTHLDCNIIKEIVVNIVYIKEAGVGPFFKIVHICKKLVSMVIFVFKSLK